MTKKVPEGGLAKITGTVADRKGTLYIANGQIEAVEEIELAHKGSLFGEGEVSRTPVYAESIGASSSWFHWRIRELIKAGLHESLTDPLPEEMLRRYNLPTLQTAIVWIHCPQSDKDALAARKRFAFEEIFFIQLGRQQERIKYKANPTLKI